MAPDSEGRQAHQDTNAEREPLVDINTEPAPSGEAKIQLKPRRKRLSDMQGRADDPQEPEPKAQRRCLSDVADAEPESFVCEPQPSSGRPRLGDTHSQVAVLDAPAEAGTLPIYDVTPERTRQAETAPTESQVDPARVEQWIAELRSKQNFPLAVAGGLLAAVVGAMVWAVITVTTNYQIGWMAVGVGCLVGGIVRVLGRGLDKCFGHLGAGLALFGCLLGNHLTTCMFIAREAGVSVTSVFTQINPAAIPSLMMATFHPLDILFYGLAVYEGYRFSFRRITEAEVGIALQNN